jgi:hypothetical protein
MSMVSSAVKDGTPGMPQRRSGDHVHGELYATAIVLADARTGRRAALGKRWRPCQPPGFSGRLPDGRVSALPNVAVMVW